MNQHSSDDERQLLAGEVFHRDSLGSEQAIVPGQLVALGAGHEEHTLATENAREQCWWEVFPLIREYSCGGTTWPAPAGDRRRSPGMDR